MTLVVMVIWSLAKRMQVQILLSNPYSLKSSFVDFIWSPYMKSKCSSKQNLMTTDDIFGTIVNKFSSLQKLWIKLLVQKN